MIYPKKSPVLERIFVKGVRVAMRRRLYGVYVRGLGNLEAVSRDRPVILCANHTNWWDGFAAALLSSFLPGKNAYLAQYEKLLARYSMFRWLGAFGLDLDGSPLPGLRCALRLLRDPRSALWIFPQGVLVPQWMPIEIKPGALWLARQSGAQVLPLALRYEWMVESRPSLFVNCGEVFQPKSSASASDEDLRKAMQTLYDGIGSSLALAPVDLTEYQPLITPRLSMNKLLDWLRRVDGKDFNPRNE